MGIYQNLKIKIENGNLTYSQAHKDIIIPLSNIDNCSLSAGSTGHMSTSTERSLKLVYKKSEKTKTIQIPFTSEDEEGSSLSETTNEVLALSSEIGKTLGDDNVKILINPVEKNNYNNIDTPIKLKKALLGAENSVFSLFILSWVMLLIPPFTLLGIYLLWGIYRNTKKSIWIYKDWLELRGYFTKTNVAWDKIKEVKGVRTYSRQYSSEKLSCVAIQILYDDASGKQKKFRVKLKPDSSCLLARILFYKEVIQKQTAVWLYGFLPGSIS